MDLGQFYLGWSQLLTRSNGEEAKNSKGARLSLLLQRQDVTENVS